MEVEKIKIFSKEEKIAILLIGLFGFSLPIILDFGYILTPIYWFFFYFSLFLLYSSLLFTEAEKKHKYI